MPSNTAEDAAILKTLELMKDIPCCEMPHTGCFHKHGDCCCSCPLCLCAYVAFQIEQGDALLSHYLPKLGYAVVVEVTRFTDSVEAGEIVALIAPEQVWFPETTAGWMPLSDPAQKPPVDTAPGRLSR